MYLKFSFLEILIPIVKFLLWKFTKPYLWIHAKNAVEIQKSTEGPVTLDIQISILGNSKFHSLDLKTISMQYPHVEWTKNLSWVFKCP